jgi:hypothetical protein
MPAMTAKKAKEIVERRRKGIYITEETRDELDVAVKQMEPTDKAITVIRSAGCFSAYNMAEWLPQLKVWKAQKAYILKCNIRTVKTAHGDVTLFVITPPDLGGDDAVCPVALCLGVMVSGYSYITKDPEFAEMCWRYLGSRE